MGVSFRILKRGARYRPRSSTAYEADDGGDSNNIESTGKINGDPSKRLVDSAEVDYDITCMPVSSTYPAQPELPGIEDYDISFTLSLFQDGYLIRKSSEAENFQSLQQDGKSLHPYDKASGALFSAIQTGLLPGDILDDIPSKYVNGAIVCEIRDYRKCNLEHETSNYASIGCAVSKIRLRMSLENVVKDIPQLSDDSWTYRDLLEVESRIVKAMQPQLHLSPTPELNRLCSDPCPDKLNLRIERKRPLRNPEVAFATRRKKPRANEASNIDNLNSTDQGIITNNALMTSIQDTNGNLSSRPNNFAQVPSARLSLPSQPKVEIQTPNFSGANTNNSGSYSEIMNGNANFLGKRENQDSQMSALQNSKRAKPNIGGLDGIQQQPFNTQFVNQNIQDMNVKNQLIRSQLEANGSQFNAPRYSSSIVTNQDANSLYFGQHGMRPVKIEQIDPMRNSLPPVIQWKNSNTDGMRKDDMLQKKKSLPSPRVSSGMVHSPVSSKSGEISSGSGALGSQKAATNSNAAIGMMSAASSPNDSAQRQHIQVKKSNSASKPQIMSAVGSPASVSNINAPMSATSPSTSTALANDQAERFAKIAMLTQRYLANTKRKKVDQIPTKRNIGRLSREVASCLNEAFGAEDFTDEMQPMSTSLVGGNINICKARVMIFSRTEPNQDVITRRLGMAETQPDGTVVMQYGDADGPKFPALYDPFLLLPNVNYADLLAAQFTKLIVKEKYQKTDDQVHPTSFYNAIPVPQNEVSSELQQEPSQGQPQPNMLTQPYTSNISNNNPQMLASRNNPQMLASQNYFSRTQQFDQSSLQQQLLHQQQQQQQQQHQQTQQQQQQQQQQLQLPQLPRSNTILSQNPLSHLMGPNANLGSLNLNPMMANKTSAQHMHLLTQQQLQQNNPMHRKMMPGPNNMGNLGMVGLGSNINNIMGMSGIRPMQGMSGIRPMQGIASSIRQPISQDQAAAIRMKMQSRMGAGVYGGIPTSMLGPAMNRINLTQQLQRSAMASMGPPKIPGQNFYQQMTPQQMAQQQMNPQQQMSSQQMSPQQQMSSQQTQQQMSPQQQMSSQLTQQQMTQQQMMNQQQMNQQQQIGSPLQQQNQMGSPSIAMSPQLSSGAMQQHMSNGNNNSNNAGGNVGVLGPGSPQLSSQTHGSVGSISSSPMDMQGPK